MSMTTVRALALFGIAIAISLILYAVINPAQQTDTAPAATAEDADYWITGLEINVFNHAGARLYRLRAADMTHARSAAMHRLTQPQLAMYSGSSLALQVSADAGLLPLDNDRIELLGNTRIERPALPDRPAITLRTSRLTVTPHQGHMTTDQPVTINSAGSELNAIGMLGEFHLQRLRLQSRVIGRHQPLTR